MEKDINTLRTEFTTVQKEINDFHNGGHQRMEVAGHSELGIKAYSESLTAKHKELREAITSLEVSDPNSYKNQVLNTWKNKHAEAMAADEQRKAGAIDKANSEALQAKEAIMKPYYEEEAREAGLNRAVARSMAEDRAKMETPSFNIKAEYT